MSRMPLPGPEEILVLAKMRADFCVSVYLKALSSKPPSATRHAKLHEMIKSAVTYLEDAGYDSQSVQACVNNLEEAVDDDEVYGTDANGLALFASPETAWAYRLPNTPPDMVEVSDKFCLKPLMRSVFFRLRSESQIHKLHTLFEARAGERRVSTNIADIAFAVTNGLVSLALINFESDTNGHISENGMLLRSNAPGSYGAITEIAHRTLKNGGRIIAVNEEHMFGDTGMAVILRRPLPAAGS